VWFLELVAQATLFLAAISLAFIPLEYFWRADKTESLRHFFWLRPQGLRPRWRDWLNDLTFYLGQVLVFNSLTIFVLGWIFNFVEPVSVNLPLPLKIFLAILCSDFLIYWGHRAQHKFKILWRFHRVHHTAEHVDYIAAYREHPLDNIYTRGIETLPAVLLGLDLNLIAGFITFRGLWALFIHSNTNIRLGFLEVLLGSPHLHHWHHELDKRGLCNYANLSPLMDLAFGTYYSPPEQPQKYGTTERVRQGWFWQMVDPFWRN
jgi:sterol desaturase/sphingolipid hydroxylase (fatty acid hydroxylase superfamily)